MGKTFYFDLYCLYIATLSHICVHCKILEKCKLLRAFCGIFIILVLSLFKNFCVTYILFSSSFQITIGILILSNIWLHWHDCGEIVGYTIWVIWFLNFNSNSFLSCCNCNTPKLPSYLRTTPLQLSKHCQNNICWLSIAAEYKFVHVYPHFCILATSDLHIKTWFCAFSSD